MLQRFPRSRLGRRLAAPLATEAEGFGVMLRRYRERLDLSVNALARAVGVDPSYVSRLEHAQRPSPRRKLVLRLTRALQLSGLEGDRLLVLAGYAPDWLVALAEQARVAPIHVPGPGPCGHCGTVVRMRTRGRCATCYRYWRRHGTERTPHLLDPTLPVVCHVCGGPAHPRRGQWCSLCYHRDLRRRKKEVAS